MNKQQTIKMLEYCGIAYKNIQPLSSRFELITINDPKTDIQCYVRKKSREMYITFRGSNSCKDWIYDIQFWKKCIPYGNDSSGIRVHTGFVNAYKSNDVRSIIQSKITNNIEKIIITGHSYGAALAILCALDLEHNFPEKDYEVFLFGSPRVGNKAFCEAYNKKIFKTFRIENGNDIVTKIPFKFLGFCHVGIEIHIGMPKLYGLLSFKHHSPKQYYKNLVKYKI